MTQKQLTTREKYKQFKLSKDATKEVDKYPALDEKDSRKMQAEFLKGKR